MLTLTFIFLSLLSTALLFKGHEKVLSITVFLTLIATLFSLKFLIEPIEHAGFFFGIVAALLSLNFILGTFLKKGIWRFILPLLSISILFILGKNNLNYNGYTLDFSSIKVTGILFLGFFFGALIDMKLVAINRFFPSLPTAQTERVITLVVAGLFTIIVTFLTSWFGFALLAIGFYLYDCYAPKKRYYISIALLLLALCANYIQFFQIESIDLSIGKVIAGLLLGGGIVALAFLGKSEHPFLLKIIILALAPILAFAIFKLDGIHPAYGGAVSFCAVIFGCALSLFFYKNNRVALFILTTTALIGFSLAPKMEVKKVLRAAAEKAQKTEDRTVTFEQVDGKKGTSLLGTSGEYTLDKTVSKINFQLGPKGGVTKGEITGIEGEIKLTEDLINSSFAIVIPVQQLSTFNEMRDESLMEEGYFEVSNFPLMSFKSDKMEAFEDGYILTGTFTMLSKSNKQEVFLKVISNEVGKLTLVGKSTIDRTKFGMPSSPQEGDLVDFYFEVVARN